MAKGQDRDARMGAAQEMYEMPFRPAIELKTAGIWGLGAVSAGVMSAWSAMPSAPFYWMGAAAVAMGLQQAAQGWQQYRKNTGLSGRSLWFFKPEELRQRLQEVDRRYQQERLWLGRGFEWGQKEAQRVYEIRKRGIDQVLPDTGEPGSPWLHGVSESEADISIAKGEEAGHTIIYGTTGAGKTRTFDLLIKQKVRRGECVFIVDPKGDQDLRASAQSACIEAGVPERFKYFHPAHADRSVRLDVMANFSRVTELASRVASLMPSEGGGDSFQAFCWMALNHVCQAQVEAGMRVSLKTLRRYIEGGPDELVEQAVEVHLDRLSKSWRQRHAHRLEKAKTRDKRIEVLIGLYESLPEGRRSTAVDGIISMHRHERTHFQKMVVGLLPVLNMLTSEPLGSLLSPAYEDAGDPHGRPILNSAKAVEQGYVVYIGLDSLTDGTVGSAIGSMILSDLTAVAGTIYNYQKGDNPRVSVFVDEAAEVINRPMIQLLNKGRGAGFKLYVATQTFPDLIERMGSKEAAAQVAGNCNNVIALRLVDQETQQLISDKLGKTVIRQIMHTQGTTAMGSDRDVTNWSGNYGERLIEAEAELFPPELFGKLPNLQFIMNTAGGRMYKGRVPIIVSDVQPKIEDVTWRRIP